MNRQFALGGLGAALTLFGIAVLFVPSLWPGQQGSADAAGPATFVWLAAIVAAVAVVVARASAAESVPADTPATARFDAGSAVSDTDQPAPASTERAVVAEQVDADLRTAIRQGGESLAEARALLRATAVEVCGDTAEASAERAERAVADGTWTDDAVAARFLAERSTWRSRLRLWVAPARERRRRIERTIGAIERLQGER
jgi:hypothetical protein